MSEPDNLPAWRGTGGHYEAWYLTFSDPATATGYWIRYTLHAPTKGAGTEAPEARLWFARFDRDRPERTLGLNRGFPIREFETPGGSAFEIKIGSALLRSGKLTGDLEGGGHSVRWDLEYDAGGATYRLLPELFYRGRLAPSKPYCPNPETRFTGTIVVDGEPVKLAGVRGQQGHVHGTKHAERWAWAQCCDFAGEPGTVLIGLSAQGRRGPVLTPYASFIGLRRAGEWIHFRKAAQTKDWGLGRWRISYASRKHRLEGTIRVEPDRLIRADYVDPDGTPRYCHNSEVASARLTLMDRRAGGFEEVAELVSDGTTHAEWGGMTPAESVPHHHQPVGAID